MKWNIEVDITNIDVDKRYYSFDYNVKLNNEQFDSGNYDSDHSWDDPEAFKVVLENGYATEIVLQRISI